MSRQSAARREKRVLKAAGVAAYARGFLPINRVTSATIAGVLESTLDTLVENGGDLTGRLRIDIGAHPQYPGRVTIEAKTDKLLPKPAGLHPIAADPRYARVKELIADDRDAEAQALEEEIAADVKRRGDCSDPRCPIDHTDAGSGDD